MLPGSSFGFFMKNTSPAQKGRALLHSKLTKRHLHLTGGNLAPFSPKNFRSSPLRQGIPQVDAHRFCRVITIGDRKLLARGLLRGEKFVKPGQLVGKVEAIRILAPGLAEPLQSFLVRVAVFAVRRTNIMICGNLTEKVQGLIAVAAMVRHL